MIYVVAGIVALAAATLWRARARARAALRQFPDTGSFVTVEGTRLHYAQDGAGPDLVLIHGSSGNIRDFDFGLMAELTQSFRVTAFDRPGLGHSDAIADPGLAAQVRLIRLAAGQLGITAPLVVGQSYGGSLALEWGLQGGPAALVLISSPSLPWPGKLDIWYRVNAHALGGRLAPWLAAAWAPKAYIQAAITAIFAPDPVPGDYPGAIGSGLTTRPKSLRENARQINALRDQLVAMQPRYGGLNIPVELVHGDADTIVPLAIHSDPLARILPDAGLTVLSGTGHMPHHARLDEVLTAIHRAATRAGLHNGHQSP